MSIVHSIPELEAWLDEHASSWSIMDDRAYVAFTREWQQRFLPRVEARQHAQKGDLAISTLVDCLPTDAVLIAGLRVPTVANMGGNVASGYHVTGLRSIHRELFNRAELIVTAECRSWTCVFNHEAYAGFPEYLYE
ncbi:MAG: hypothetical protein AAF078_04840 [Planctomycetota bacterium]